MIKKIIRPCIVGLGYVVLPLFLKLQKKIKTIGYDNNKSRIIDLNSKLDSNNEFKAKDLLLKKKSVFTFNENLIRNCNFYIITVPTPVLKYKKPDLTYLKKSCKTIGKFLKKDNIVFFESTVYP